MRIILTIANRLRQLRRDDRGTAAVEFALITPFLLTLYLGSMEAGALFTVDKRVNTISATIGDLVAQQDPQDSVTPILSTATLTTYFDAAKGIMTPYSLTGVKQVVSLIFVKSDGTTKVIWSKANGTGAVARTQGASYTALGSGTTTNDVARGGCIIASEVSYSYKPLLGAVFTVALNLSHVNYFIPRYGATDTIQVDSPTLAHPDTACTTGVY
jgi:Flp pilus assembly protein TadG